MNFGGPVVIYGGGSAATDSDITSIGNITVARGSLIYGNATPEWVGLSVGTGVLYANGTDVSGWTMTPTLTNLTLTRGTITASDPLTISQTWNNGAVDFNGLVIDITNTASGAGSRVLNVKVGGTSIFALSPASLVIGGNLHFVSTAKFDSGLNIESNSLSTGVNFGADADVPLRRDAAGVLALRNSTTAQISRIYRTYTDASNYERLALQSGAGYFEIAAETAGTGTDDINVKLTPSGIGAVILAASASQKIACYGVTAVVQASRAGQLTDSTTGTSSTTCVDVGVVFSQAAINNNFASVLAKLNAVETIIHNIGISA